MIGGWLKKKRVAAETNEDDKEKTAKRAKLSVAQELLCPISMELPIDPVTADGKILYFWLHSILFLCF